MKNNKKGFTLIEMLIVITIIGILSALILVGLSSFRMRGRDARRIADVRQAQNGLEIYYTKNLKYPTVAAGSPASRWTELTTTLTGAGIGLTQIPQDPLAPDSSYDYKDGNSQQNYVIAVTLEDGDNSSLKNDMDGSIFGINCDDPAYCVQF